jgi:hypothetical protein
MVAQYCILYSSDLPVAALPHLNQMLILTHPVHFKAIIIDSITMKKAGTKFLAEKNGK